MSIANIVARGFGPQAQIKFIVTRGFEPSYLTVSDTDTIQKPVDYYMEDLPQFADRYRTSEGNVRALKKTILARPAGSLRGGKSAFTVRTDKKGYN